MKSILTLLIPMAVFTLSAQTAISAEITYPSEELTYRSGFYSELDGPVSINWKGNWMSISLPPAVAGYDTAQLEAFATFGAFAASRYERPLSLSIRIQKMMEPLDLAILPENYRECVETITQMAALTLEKDKEAGKLTARGIAALEKLRDGCYTLSDLSGDYIDLRWSTEYQGKMMTRTLNYTSPDAYCNFKFTGDVFTLQLRNVGDFRTITATYRDGNFEGGYQRFDSAEAIMEKDALALIKNTLKSIEAVYSATRTPVPEEVAEKLRLVRKVIASGFTSFNETAHPSGIVGGT